MLSVAEAKQRLVAILAPVAEIEAIPLGFARQRVLAADVASNVDSPSFSNSGMDGFAVISGDLMLATKKHPVTLEIIGDIPAGEAPQMVLKQGQAVRIMTGAPLPKGADAVVPVERTSVKSRDAQAPLPSSIEAYDPANPGDYVRRRGEDFSEGAIVLEKGSRLRSQDIGMLAMQGIGTVEVFRKPKIGLLSTGDELISVEEELKPGKIRDINSHTLGALIASCGCEAVNLGVAKDTMQDVESVFARAETQRVDLIVSSAGVSVGAYDFVRAAIEKHGRVDFWRVNMRPGKPLLIGGYKGIPFVGLPGNPVSSFIGFEVFLRPALHHLAGVLQWNRPVRKVHLADSIESDGRESYLRVNLDAHEDKLHAQLAGHQGSGNLYSLVLADGLVIIPAGVKSLVGGAEVEYWSLSDG
jgi:molybdopterin molybdotransferase